MLKKILNFKIISLTLIILTIISSLNFCLLYLLTPSSLLDAKILILPQNSSIKEISAKLAEAEVIKYPKIFWFISSIYSLKYKLKSGEYKFTAQISPAQVIRILVEGKSIIHKLVIKEGVTISEIVEKINEEKRLFGIINEKIPEGFLMPSTYFYSYGDQKQRIIEQMRSLMSKNLDIVMSQLSPDSPLKTRMDVLILASIVEKEAQLDSERPIIAAVFLNRLKKNMKLQADPTTIYAITDGKFKLARSLTKSDLAIQSPYNTYYILNLPPAPISCPGFKSLQSVVNPAKTSAIYFVVDGTGGHNFSSTLSEHNKHVENYRKLRDANSTELKMINSSLLEE